MQNVGNKNGLDALEEHVYGDVITRIRALEVSEAERKPFIEEAMRILCDAQDALAGTDTGEAAHADAVTQAWEALGALERKLG